MEDTTIVFRYRSPGDDRFYSEWDTGITPEEWDGMSQADKTEIFVDFAATILDVKEVIR
jgi:hypothetical protein